MLLLLFALAAYAQPAIYGGTFFGAGTSAPAYAQSTISRPATFFPAPVQPAPVIVGPSLFELRQQDRAVRASELDLRANNMFYNTPWEAMFPGAPTAGLTAGFGRYGATVKAKVNALNEERLQYEIDHFRATHPRPLSREDQNTLDDLILQRESFHDNKIRRFVSTIPGTTISSTGAPIASFYERRATENNYVLAENALQDNRDAYQDEPNRDNLIGLRNARDDVEQADDRRDAVTFDLLGGTFNGAGRFGPILRKRASQTKLEIGRRNVRVAEQEFINDPSEDNRLNLQLANLFVRATKEEDAGNKADVVVGSLMPNVPTLIKAFISSGKNFQDESRLWLRYDRLKRQILLRERAKTLQGNPDSVAARFLGLSMYGPSAGIREPVSTDVSRGNVL
jgi:hypothetical protein